MSYHLPGSLFLACRAMLQRPRNDPDVPFGRIVEARLYWYNNEDQIRAIDCVLYYAEMNLERPVVAGLYDVQTSVRLYYASN